MAALRLCASCYRRCHPDVTIEVERTRGPFQCDYCGQWRRERARKQAAPELAKLLRLPGRRGR
jgi:predicted RNA-binding Zn-ribbon protein involved in translation (DUF1610 family)